MSIGSSSISTLRTCTHTILTTKSDTQTTIRHPSDTIDLNQTLPLRGTERQTHSSSNNNMATPELNEGYRIRFTYHRGTNPGSSREAVFRNFYDSRNGRGFYADDGTLQGGTRLAYKLFLMRYVTDLEVIADDTDDEDVSFSQSVREQIARLDRLRAEMDSFLAKLDALKRALDDSDQGGRRVRRRL
eukprot:COSAG02_NODE_828_length_16703_cov_298.705312_3_plen_187_part_00